MRLWIAAIAALTAGAAVAATPAPAWQTVETTQVGALTLTVESQDGAENSPRLVIAAPGGRATTISLNGGLAAVSDAISTKALADRNTLHSKYLFATDALKDRASGDRLLVVFGAAEDPDPYAIRVLHVAANGRVQTLYSNEAFELTGIADLNKDGVPELIGRPSWSQMDAKCLSTYDPTAVLRLSGGQYVDDEKLSKTYNIAHYVWAGPKSREDIAVNICIHPPKLATVPKGH